MAVVCVFGDSTAWGAYDMEKGGWVERLKLFAFEESREETFVYNLGIAGGTSKGILGRFESEAHIREAEALVFQMGGNDSAYLKNSKEEMIPLDQFKSNVESIITKAKDMVGKKNIVFVGFKNCDESKTVPVHWCDWCYTNERIKTYNDALQQLCEKNEMIFVDLFGILSVDELADGLHPNTQGHEKIFRHAKEYIEPLL
jgi:lysophospholipase L1-like esterase